MQTVFFVCVYYSLVKKGPWAVHLTLGICDIVTMLPCMSTYWYYCRTRSKKACFSSSLNDDSTNDCLRSVSITVV